jgi:hypothetical protein
MNKYEIYNALIESFKATPPDSWGYGDCASGRLMRMGLIEFGGVDRMGSALGLYYEEAYKLYYRVADGDGSLFERMVDMPHIQANIIRVLTEARDTGKVNWNF